MSNNINTAIISAFPGTGKSHFFKNYKGGVVLDSDSSKFDKSKFPENYIEHIKNNIGKADVILVSSHEVVRKALVENDIPFILVYPPLSDKEEYLNRYKRRGSPESFIKLLESNWETWIKDCERQGGCVKVQLHEGDYLSDIFTYSL